MCKIQPRFTTLFVRNTTISTSSSVVSICFPRFSLLADLFWKVPCLVLKSHLGWLHPMEARNSVPDHRWKPNNQCFYRAFPSGKPETRSEMTYMSDFPCLIYLCYVVSYNTRRVVSALLFPPFFIQQPEKIMIKIKSSW